jgi:hypothetical protein
MAVTQNDQQRPESPKTNGTGSLLKLALRLKKPIPLIGFLLVLVLTSKLIQYKLTHTEQLIVVILMVIIVVAGIFLFYLNLLSQKWRPLVILIFFLGILGLIILVIVLALKPPPPPPDEIHIIVTLEDTSHQKLHFINETNLILSKNGQARTFNKIPDRSVFDFIVPNTPNVLNDLDFALDFPGGKEYYRFSNNSPKIRFSLSKPDTTLQLFPIVVPVSIVEKTFKIVADDYEVPKALLEKISAALQAKHYIHAGAKEATVTIIFSYDKERMCLPVVAADQFHLGNGPLIIFVNGKPISSQSQVDGMGSLNLSYRDIKAQLTQQAPALLAGKTEQNMLNEIKKLQ